MIDINKSVLSSKFEIGGSQSGKLVNRGFGDNIVELELPQKKTEIFSKQIFVALGEGEENCERGDLLITGIENKKKGVTLNGKKESEMAQVLQQHVANRKDGDCLSCAYNTLKFFRGYPLERAITFSEYNSVPSLTREIYKKTFNNVEKAVISTQGESVASLRLRVEEKVREAMPNGGSALISCDQGAHWFTAYFDFNENNVYFIDSQRGIGFNLGEFGERSPDYQVYDSNWFQVITLDQKEVSSIEDEMNNFIRPFR